MSVYVYLGPTLSVAHAKAVLPDATFLPPVSVGDLYALVARHKPTVIGIVDGLFEGVPAVWHKEILFALSKGVRVLGSSSMGALRAAELDSFGMVGVGTIFKNFAAGTWEDDDEVTVVHGDAAVGYRLASEAMANIRHGLDLAAAEGAITASSRDALTHAAKALFYPDRSWGRVRELGKELGIPQAEIDALAEFVRRVRPNLKRDDALEMLRVIASEEFPARPPPFHFELTEYFTRLAQTNVHDPIDQRDTAVERALTAYAVRDHVRVHPAREDLLGAALLHALVVAEAMRLGLSATPEQMSAAADRFRRARHLLSASATEQWLRDNGVSKESFLELVRFEALCDALIAYHEVPVRESVALALKRRGEWLATVAALRRQKSYLSVPGASVPTFASLGISVETLVGWYKANYRAVGERDLEAHATALGFSSLRVFLNELLEKYAATHASGEEP